ncbi:hypothetical protein LTR56_020760 [Elasticomyces elasticus]|nr:hypothetical protein LTR22_024199 [Elasticomyces elasticus]KAK3624863.1 hypothetical protein LTR56_020760 [Elasticomyces elasticus]KAK4909857.1 hypothetical protein LTR49_021397 [Elasticomyces elasticus]
MAASLDRSLAQEQDIKSEFFEQAIVNNPGEAINLDSDDENDLMPPPPTRTVPLPSIALSDNGLFVPETSPAPSISLQRTREVQAKFAQEMRQRLLLKAVAAGSTTSDVVASGRDDHSETSVVVRRKGDEESRAFARIKARIHKAIADEEWARGASEEEVASITETVRDHFLAPRPADGTSDDDDVPETSVKGRSRERMADDYGPAPKRARKTTAAKAAATGDGRKKKLPAAKGKAPKAKAGQQKDTYGIFTRRARSEVDWKRMAMEISSPNPEEDVEDVNLLAASPVLPSIQSTLSCETPTSQDLPSRSSHVSATASDLHYASMADICPIDDVQTPEGPSPAPLLEFPDAELFEMLP